MSVTAAETPDPHVVILGAGFGGLETARWLGKAGIRVTLIDRQNHHLFQPLLYQVATAALSSADIAEPVRRILQDCPSVDVAMADVTGIDTVARRVDCADGTSHSYDVLVVATGSTPSYFGNAHWKDAAPGLKTVADAQRIRSNILRSFEEAETCTDPESRAALMTIAVVGGGPTGVELAGSVAELCRHTLKKEFRHIDPRAARILLIEAAPRLLSGFAEPLGRYVHQRLQKIGVTVMTDTKVEDIRPGELTLDGAALQVGQIIWTAGVAASPLGQALGVGTDRTGRITTGPTLELPDLPGVFAIGDIASVPGPDGKPLPALAQVARQQGKHLGRALADRITRGTALPPFEYRSRGNTSIVGRHAAVYETAHRQVTGWPAWLLWAVVHVYLLVGFQNRLVVSMRWLWRYLTNHRGARLILDAPERR